MTAGVLFARQLPPSLKVKPPPTKLNSLAGGLSDFSVVASRVTIAMTKGPSPILTGLPGTWRQKDSGGLDMSVGQVQ